MAITTYATLKSTLTDWIDRGTDLDSKRDDFIDFAEAYFNRTLRCYQMEETSTLTTDSNGEASLPTGFLAFRSVRYSSSPSIELKPISHGGANVLSPYGTSDTPRWYSVSSGTTADTTKIRITPPKSSASLIVRFFEKIPALSDSTTSNWLLDLAPDIYFYRCLGEAWAFMRDFEKAAAYYAQAKGLCEELQLLDDRSRYLNAEFAYDGVVD